MNKLEQLFHPVVEIFVIENVEDEIDPPKVIVDLEVGLMLRVGDIIVFNGIGTAKMGRNDRET